MDGWMDGWMTNEQRLLLRENCNEILQENQNSKDDFKQLQ